jgi:hypothetical protein
MEAKPKIIAAVAVIMMCAAGLVGAGYAYTASTTNDGNSATSEYVIMSQQGPGAYKFADGARVYYDTVNSMVESIETNVYTLDNGIYNTLITGATVVHLGEQIELHATSQNRAAADLSCSFTTTGFTKDANWLFYIVINNGTTIETKTISADNTWGENANFTIKTAGVAGAYTSATVDVYYGYAGNTGVSIAASAAQPSGTVLSGATITFTATTANGLTLDAYGGAISTNDGTLVIHATLNGLDATDVSWSTSNAAVATVAGSDTNNLTGTVTATGNGSVVITASVTVAGVTYTASCSVTVTNQSS